MPLFSYDAFAQFDDDPAHRQSIALEGKKDDEGKDQERQVKDPKEMTNGTVEKKKLIPVKQRTKLDPSLKSNRPGLYFNIKLDGKYTLIKSVMILKKWYICKEYNIYKTFQRFIDNDEKLSKMMQCMMEKYRISIKLPKECYTHHAIGFQLQKFLDYPKPNLFRIFIFETQKQPIWKSDVQSYTVPIVIHYSQEENTYQPVRNIGRLFYNKGNYCFSCEIPYTIAEHHRESCKNKCSFCQRVGLCYPCKDEGVSIKCQECHRVFKNKDCFAKHLAVFKGKKLSVCNRIRVCENCSAVYHHFNGHNCRKRKQEQSKEVIQQKKEGKRRCKDEFF